MKIESRYGEFTITCARIDDVVDPDRLVVRACSSFELEALRDAYPKLSHVAIVQENTVTAAMMLPKHIWSHIVEDMVLDIDYGTFVPEETHRMPLNFYGLTAHAA